MDYRAEHGERRMHDAGVLVLAGDLEGEPRTDRIQGVGQRHSCDARRRARHELVAVLD